MRRPLFTSFFCFYRKTFRTTLVCSSLFARKHFSPIEQLTLERSLQELDSAILQKPMFHKYHEVRLDSFKQELSQTHDLWKAYHLCGSLFYEYLHFQADSSLHYIEQKAQLLPLLKAPHLQDEIHINRAEVYNIKGMYTESLAELQATPPTNDRGNATLLLQCVCQLLCVSGQLSSGRRIGQKIQKSV